MNIYNLITFFDDIEDLLNKFVDRVELKPVELINDLYLTGIRRSSTMPNTVELHLKQIRKVKLEGVQNALTDKNGYMMMEADGEVWAHILVIDETILELAMTKFAQNFKELSSFYVMTTTYKDDTDKFIQTQVTLYEDKKTAYKDALAMRKIHKNVSNKFQLYNNQGEPLDYTPQSQTQHEPSDFELVTCKVE